MVFLGEEIKMQTNMLVNLFLDLVKIPSPSGKEKEVAEYICHFLKNHMIPFYLDTSGEKNDSNTGNIIANISGTKGCPSILFTAHMDTVETGEKSVNPTVKNKIITSDKTTILGADDKAGIAVLLNVLLEIQSWKKRPTIWVAFTTREEQGQMGARFLKVPKVKYGFILDATGPVGRFTYKSLGQKVFVVKILGKSAHAAGAPEKGMNAIRAAGVFLLSITQGKRKDGSTINIGTIKGGVGTNVVADVVEMQGEVRGYTESALDKRLLEVKKALKTMQKKTGCKFNLVEDEANGAPPFASSKNSEIVVLAKKALKNVGLPFSLMAQHGTTEANFLSQKIPVLNVCRGGNMAHSTEESILIEELEQSQRLVLGIASVLVS